MDIFVHEAIGTGSFGGLLGRRKANLLVDNKGVSDVIQVRLWMSKEMSKNVSILDQNK